MSEKKQITEAEIFCELSTAWKLAATRCETVINLMNQIRSMEMQMEKLIRENAALKRALETEEKK
jgi:hypothetical protein